MEAQVASLCGEILERDSALFPRSSLVENLESEVALLRGQLSEKDSELSVRSAEVSTLLLKIERLEEEVNFVVPPEALRGPNPSSYDYVLRVQTYPVGGSATRSFPPVGSLVFVPLTIPVSIGSIVYVMEPLCLCIQLHVCFCARSPSVRVNFGGKACTRCGSVGSICLIAGLFHYCFENGSSAHCLHEVLFEAGYIPSSRNLLTIYCFESVCSPWDTLSYAGSHLCTILLASVLMVGQYRPDLNILLTSVFAP
ncbi:uncharacterized protein G2W53_040119 [Senna tora]|uniref:Uncharacterized protein n=1 Tax=Senna tora TaxID=362788 RepID=A0A834SRN1_9FABA|nr:uncharacterized protein G2W53_040119 [Senna tora]